MKNYNKANTIQIRIDINENDPLFEKFNAIKKGIGINANTEVIRYSINKTFDFEFDQKEKAKT